MSRKTTLSLIMGTTFVLGSVALNCTATPLATDKCAYCHGDTGNSDYDHVPNIAGFSTFYFTDAINSYGLGDRPSEDFKADGHEETNMKAVVASLTDKEIAELAKYYASQEFTARDQKVNAKLAKRGKRPYRKCRKCHTANGSDPDDDAGILAGQSMSYLKAQIQYFKDGTRTQPKKMAKAFKKLRKGDIKKLLHFFASQK